MTQRIGNPLPFFTDKRGLPMDGGRLYVGEVNEDPELSPVTLYLDEACTAPIAQPLLIVGGFATDDGNPAFFYVQEDTYSLRVRDRDGGEVYYFADAVVEQDQWQPVNPGLSAIAALVTTAYGRGVLTQPDASALRTYLGMVASLPLSGGTMTGNILRNGGGPHVYHTNTAFTSGRIFITAAGAPDPTTLPGDIWLERAP
ncbi:phage tailspike protein [Novosphingobium sp. M1R2S20]|uniref:Phage tailspike protein n=1 Tax=Novosphingobium rhizovicinum TaxID=3228928 RepID=A0ABV3RCU8_9SPHN